MKPSIPKGTRDFSPQEMVRRNYLFDTIKQVFQRYGYLPIETPAMENLSTLMGKYGDEGDKLIFKILNSGDFKDGVDVTLDSKKLTTLISEKALRYDLTVPFARYVVQHQHEISFPFKRYQIQPVWRADRPQKGRYREFYQCDADVIGSNSLLNEVELVQLIDDVFSTLKIPVRILINNRKILYGLVGDVIGEKERIVNIIVALDKFEKIGDKIYDELREQKFEEDKIQKLKVFINEFLILKEGNQRINYLKNIFVTTSPLGLKGIEEIEYIFDRLGYLKLEGNFDGEVEIDLTLARGLNYYTGAIFEVQVDRSKCKSEFTSSICGGGRYDDLTGVFGLPNMSGVGISFGADRIYDVLNELNVYPESVSASTKILFVNFGEAEQNYCLPLLAKVRKAGINAEIYPDAGAKMKKQMGYADDKKIPFVVIVGTDEMQNGLLSIKNMASGEQEKITIDAIIEKLKSRD